MSPQKYPLRTRTDPGFRGFAVCGGTSSFAKWMKITYRCVCFLRAKGALGWWLPCILDLPIGLFRSSCMMWLPLTNLSFWFSCFQDDFNLTGLSTMVPYYDYALDMVLDVEMPMEDSLTEEQQEIVESAAEMLYGLIHARYIITNRGMHAMYEKYRMAHFGRCPHVFCQGQPVLPVGLSDLPRNYTVNVFCPRCHGLFFPKSTRQANIDGAYFGTTFPHLYLMTHPVRPAFSCHLMEHKVNLLLIFCHWLLFYVCDVEMQDMVPTKPTQAYQPRVYGFRVNEQSLYYKNREDNANNTSQRTESSNPRQSRRSKRSGRKS